MPQSCVSKNNIATHEINEMARAKCGNSKTNRAANLLYLKKKIMGLRKQTKQYVKRKNTAISKSIKQYADCFIL